MRGRAFGVGCAVILPVMVAIFLLGMLLTDGGMMGPLQRNAAD